MKAVGCHDFGRPDVLEVVNLPEPHAGPGEVRLRVHAAAVNPTDTVRRSGALAAQLRADPPPYVPGMDAAGVLDEIGEGVATDLRLGDHVMAIVVPSGSHGAYAEQVVVPAESVVRVPRGLDDVGACTLPMNALTAQLTLDVLDLAEGQTLAVTGAAGCFGGYVVELAKVGGLRVIGDAAESDEGLVAGLGADVVVRRGDDVAGRFFAACPGGVEAVADGALLHTLALGAVRDGGRLAAVRPFVGETERQITVHQVWVRTYAREHDKLDRLRQLVEDGRLTPRVAARFRPEEAAEAHRLLEAGGIRGRLVIEF